MSNYIVSPAQGVAFAILILGWLACDHVGLTDACVEAYGPPSVQEAGASPQTGQPLR